MTPVALTVNGIPVSETVEPRTHLADLLRDKLCLTGTHLRCEQGACGSCTLLIDGQPARSCITYAVMCQGADITTIEGLENDPVMTALRQAFAIEHGLQCGFCTPGMLITARDIVVRLPDADERRIRLELSGNLCRCTGYVGIVRAICRVLEERKGGKLVPGGFGERRRLGPLDRSMRRIVNEPLAPIAAGEDAATHPMFSDADLGLGGKTSNIEIRQSFVIGRPPRRYGGFWRTSSASSLACRGPCSPARTATGGRARSPSDSVRLPPPSTGKHVSSGMTQLSVGSFSAQDGIASVPRGQMRSLNTR